MEEAKERMALEQRAGVVLGRIAEVVEGGRVNANQLGSMYRARYGEALDFRGLGYSKLGALLDGGDGELFRLERQPPVRSASGERTPGSLFLKPLDDDDEEEEEEEEEGEEWTVVGYYAYSRPRWSEAARDATVAWKTALATACSLNGRIRIACEGANANLTGRRRDAERYCDLLRKADPFWVSRAKFQFEPTTKKACWRRLKAWAADEACGLGCDAEEQARLDLVGPGVKLSPADFEASLKQKGPRKKLLIDTRNVYEVAVGRFEPSSNYDFVDPETRVFSDFPGWVDRHADLLEGADVFMYCTGGVRCERASALVKLNAQPASVYHLDGGLVNYLKSLPPGGTSMFQGKNYVFDRRASSAVPTAGSVLGVCLVCHAPWDDYRGKRRCLDCNTLVLVCDPCQSAGRDRANRLRCRACTSRPVVAAAVPPPPH